MKMQGERLIRATRQDVWNALNDPDVLRQCIPGCEEMQKVSDTAFAAKVRAKVGPVSLSMTGDVQLSDLNPPVSYRIAGQGKGGAAGFAKGGADISLKDQAGSTVIVYDVDAQVGGKLAQIGNRLFHLHRPQDGRRLLLALRRHCRERRQGRCLTAILAARPSRRGARNRCPAPAPTATSRTSRRIRAVTSCSG